jgi:calcium-dependent protein kinase
MAKRFSHFAHLSGVKKAALTASVRYLKGFEVEELRKHFELFDVDGDGQVTLNEFISAVGKWPQILAEEFDSAEELFRALDSDGSGQISYTEFLAADSDIKLEAREDLARKAFEAFDQKGDGEITSEDIRRVFGGVRQGTADLEEIGIKNGEAAQFEKFRDHLRSP